MNIVSYGGGVNSTAMLVGMYKKGIPVDLILFADPGGEQPYTYEYLPIMDDWLARHGMPRLQTVYCTDKNGEWLRCNVIKLEALYMEQPKMKRVHPFRDALVLRKGHGKEAD